MNTYLEKLFVIYNISEKDRHEIKQIFWLLPIEKQQKLLNNFWKLASKLEFINKDINLERKILIWDLFKDIESFYDKYGNNI